nr:hypothetical protein [Tanacetum cinerariifolium]
TPSDSKWTPKSTLSIWKHLGRCCISFAELPFEEEILEFLRFLGHNAQIKTLTDSQVISSADFIGAISQKKRRLCLSHLGRSCVSSGTQESKEKQRDVLTTIHKSHHSSLHDEETFNP